MVYGCGPLLHYEPLVFLEFGVCGECIVGRIVPPRSMYGVVRSLWGGAVWAVSYGMVLALRGVRCRYGAGTVMSCTLLYCTGKYTSHDAVRLVFLFYCWGGDVACVCDLEC